MSNYLLDLVRRGAGLAPAVAPEPSLQPDFGPLLPMDAIPEPLGMFPAEEAHPDAPIPRAPTLLNAPERPTLEPEPDPPASDRETAPNTLSQSPTGSESDSKQGARHAVNAHPPESSSEDATLSSGDSSGGEMTLQRSRLPSRPSRPELPDDDASLQVPAEPETISPGHETREDSPQAGSPGLATPVENLPPASPRQRHRQPESPGDALPTGEPSALDAVSLQGDTRGHPTQGRSPKVEPPADNLQTRAKTVMDENHSPERATAKAPHPEDAPTASRDETDPNPEATIEAQPRVPRTSVESPGPRSQAITDRTTAAHGTPEARVSPLEDHSRANARVSDPDRGAQDVEVPDRSGPVLPEAQPPGRPGGRTTRPAGGEPEGSRNSSLPPTAEGAMRTPTRLAPRTVQGQPERSGQGDESQNSRKVPARSGMVPRSREGRAAPAIDLLSESTVLAAREEPASSRSRSQTIQVHIGKVEVRAATPPAAPAPRAPRPQGFEGYELMRSYLSWERQ